MTSNEKKTGNRRFYDLPKCPTFQEKNEHCLPNELLYFIHTDIIGRNNSFIGPFGRRNIVFCDHVASSRALNSIESYINKNVLQSYGNTHTTTTVTSLQSSMFQEESRTIIRNAVRADEHDAVIFTGNGVTAAVHKLINALNLKAPPVVFVGPYEHHSNLLPWREIAAHIISISECSDGSINLEHLELALQEWKSENMQMIGCFSAASNVTGIITNTVAVTTVLHKYGALAFWDYATGGPYLDIDMHPHSRNDAHKDAIFLSMHKFVGGVDAPGVLIASRKLFKNSIPSDAGGGSVFFVSRSSHRYLQDEEMREEGGTPRVVGIARAALAFQLKQSIGANLIMQTEEQFCVKAFEEWKNFPNLHLLGNPQNCRGVGNRLAVFSFMVSHSASKLYLHHNFVATLLNDIFGIQARGGCACSGPYAQELLGIDETTADEFENALLQNSRLDRVHLRRNIESSPFEILRPGFVRLNIPYFAHPDEARYVTRAVAMVSELGWRCLPSYKFNPETGEWRHMNHKIFADRIWLSDAKFTGNGLQVRNPSTEQVNIHGFDELLKMAEDIFESSAKVSGNFLPDHATMFDDDVAHLRWFLLPSEALSHLMGRPSPFHNCSISVRTNIKQLTTEEIKERIKKPTMTYPTHDVTSPWNKSTSTSSCSNDVTSSSRLQNAMCATKCPSREKKVPAEEEIDSPTADTKQLCFIPPPKRLFRLTSQAIDDYDMIQDGDRVLVCLSGGKDSLSLLHVLHQIQFYSKSKRINFQLGAVTVDPMTSSYDPSPLIPYLESLDVPYFYEKQDIVNEAMRASASSICSFCSRMKRGRIYACARREKWNVLAFGQHLDDLAESFIMSAFHNGLLRTMKANYKVKEGDLRVIRPFVYVRETDTRQFAESSRLPVIPENCPACFEAPKERHRVKQLLASQEILHPRLFASLKEALHPLMARNKTGMESGRHSSCRDDDL